jgi:hypothetical protein
VLVAFSLVSMLLYTIHGGMAVYVKKVMDREEEEKRRNPATELAVVDPDEAQLARDRWRALGRYEL